MLVRRFLCWVQTAPAAARASAVSALAKAYLGEEMDALERSEAENALTLMLDDGSAMVRRALAEALADAGNAPAHVIAALSADRSDIAAIVLSRSPLPTEAELVERVAVGDVLVQTAIAIRPFVGAPLAAAIAEVAEVEALAKLAANPGADILEFSLMRMVQRHGNVPALRVALLERRDLPVSVRQSLMASGGRPASPAAHGRELTVGAPAEQPGREVAEKATLDLARITADAEMPALVQHLRRSGQLTASLLLRAVVMGEPRLFAASLVELTGQSAARVSALIADRRGGAFDAIYAKAGLPPALMPAFRTALDTRQAADPQGIVEDAALVRTIVAAVLAVCESPGLAEQNGLVAMLRKVDAEAAREEARAMTEAVRAAYQADLAAPLLLATDVRMDFDLADSVVAARSGEGALDDSGDAEAATRLDVQIPAAMEQAADERAPDSPAAAVAIGQAQTFAESDYAALADMILAGRSWHSGYRAASAAETPALAGPAFVEPALVEPVFVEPASVEPASVEPAVTEPVAVAPDVVVEPSTEARPEVVTSTTSDGGTVLHGEILSASPDQDTFLADIAWLADITHRPEPLWGADPAAVSPAASGVGKDAQKGRERTMAA